MYLEDSRPIGEQMERSYLKAADSLPAEERSSAFNRLMNAGGHITDDLEALAARYSSRWLAADYAAGDIVLHNPYVIHAANTNRRTDGVIRLSLDIRFQGLSTQLDSRWLNDWRYNDGL